MAGDGPSDPRRDGVYKVIRLVALMDVVIGLAVLILGGAVLGTTDYRYLGLGMAIAGGGVFVFFTRLAAQAARR
jgi:hypothetical protein